MTKIEIKAEYDTIIPSYQNYIIYNLSQNIALLFQFCQKIITSIKLFKVLLQDWNKVLKKRYRNYTKNDLDLLSNIINILLYFIICRDNIHQLEKIQKIGNIVIIQILGAYVSTLFKTLVGNVCKNTLCNSHFGPVICKVVCVY